MARFRLFVTRWYAESGAESTSQGCRRTNDVVNRKARNRPNHKNPTSPAGFGSSQPPLAARFTNPPSSVRTLFTGHNISMISI